MLLLLILLLQWRFTVCVSSPTLEDNRLPTDDEVLTDLINSYRGQPEEEIALNLPTDEEAFNEIKPVLQSGSPFYYVGSNNGHFVSSAFPEIDARGFHESVFDNLNDFYTPLQRGKKYDSPVSVSARGFYGDVFTDGFGSFHPVKRFYRKGNGYQELLASHFSRQKRSTVKAFNPASNNVTVEKIRIHASDSESNYTPPKTCSPGTNNANCVKLKIFLTNDPKNDKFWKILNHQSKKNHTQVRYKRSPRELHHKYGPNFWKNYPDLFFHLLKVNRYRKRLPESNFHEDVFQNGFGEFEPLKKRRPEQDNTGLESGVFNEFGGFDTLKKRVPEISSSGFHEDLFNGGGFGNFETLKKRVPEGFHHADVFNGGFGSFETLRKRVPESVNNDAFNRDFGQFTPLKRIDQYKHSPRIINGDAFHHDFGYFDTVKRRPDAVDVVNGDAFYGNFGRFEPLKRDSAYYSPFEDYPNHYKRKMSSELDSDTFHGSFGNFETLKKRKQGLTSSGRFNDDTFHRDQFGYFDPLRKRRLEDINSDAFYSNFGNFNTMKRRPELINGDAFHSTFGSFDTLKKRVPEMNSAGFHSDVFNEGFGNFDVSKRTSSLSLSNDDYHLFKHLLRDYIQSAASDGKSSPVSDTNSSKFDVHSNSSSINN